MSGILKMAFRNVFRFKRRTLITFSAISIGLALLIISICLINGIDKQSLRNIVNSQVGYLTVFREGYFEEKDDLPLSLTIPDARNVLQAVARIPQVQAAESRVLFSASLIKGADELPCLGVGVEPEKDPQLFNIEQSLEKGRWLKPGEDKILIGHDLADDAGLDVGDIVTLRLVTSDREEQLSWNAIDVEIAGIFDTGNPATDSQMIFMPLSQAQVGLGLGSSVTEIPIRLRSDPADLESLAKVKMQLQSVLANLDMRLQVYTWEELAGIFETVSAMKKKSTQLIIFIILFIAAMGMINTMLMAVFERTREIGMLSAMGMKRREILLLYVLEGGFIGTFGSIFGCLLGGLGGWYLQAKGLSLTALAGANMAKITSAFYPLKNVLYGDMSLHVLVQTFLLGTLVAIAASLYPAWKATRLNPSMPWFTSEGRGK